MRNKKLTKIGYKVNGYRKEIKALFGAKVLKAIEKHDVARVASFTMKDWKDFHKEMMSKRAKKATQKAYLEQLKRLVNSWNIEKISGRHNRFKQHMAYADKCDAAHAKRSERHKRVTSSVNSRLLPKTRLNDERRDATRLFISRFIKQPNGKTSMDISFTNKPANVVFKTETCQGDWIQYSRKVHWKSTDLNIKAVFPKSWVRRVLKKGFDFIGGVPTLDISTPLLLDTRKEFDVYAIKWLHPSRGSNYRVVDGFVAIKDNVSFHAKSIAAAKTGLRRKLKYIESGEEPPKRKPRLNPIISRALKANDVIVTIADSYAVGNCIWGTENFCYRHDIDMEKGISLHSLAEIAKKEPMQELMQVLRFVTK